MDDQRDPEPDADLAALAKRDTEVAAAMEAEQRGRSGDFGGSLSANWDHRRETDEEWDAAALGFTLGQPIDLHRRDGSVVSGKVRATSDGHGWWRPLVEDGSVVFEDGTRVAIGDIVSVSSVPDAEHTHDLGPVEDGERPPDS